ncbi:hypothetical protein [Nocardiopsis sp. CNT312]|uniref:hypothetical protein n=1 Tax=Nocardiopsis sp. CNT312 TaxID=1137268 RepID=UPI00048DAC9F|nr:hypothetical protein [Nocardiopsis sp. CNT312]
MRYEEERLLSHELRLLVDVLSELRLPVRGWFVPGSSPHRVRELLGSDVPEEVVDWFGWCGGIEFHPGQTQEDADVVPGYSLIGLQDAVETYKAIEGLYEGDPVLGASWVPILQGRGADFYAVVWGESEGCRVACVVQSEPVEIEFPSLEGMISFFNECYRRTVFFVDESGWVHEDFDRYEQLYDEFFS